MLYDIMNRIKIETKHTANTNIDDFRSDFESILNTEPDEYPHLNCDGSLSKKVQPDWVISWLQSLESMKP